jgi:hypothetical protein
MSNIILFGKDDDKAYDLKHQQALKSFTLLRINI